MLDEPSPHAKQHAHAGSTQSRPPRLRAAVHTPKTQAPHPFDTISTMFDELKDYLTSLTREDNFRVLRTLKESPTETTELVELVGAGEHARGPFIRKTITADSGVGKTYGTLAAAHKAGFDLAHAPKIYDAYQREDAFVVIMEYIQGQTLQDHIYANNPSKALLAQWFPALCDAVLELHTMFESPIIHRDLKPSNIMISNGDQGPKLTIIDLGIARKFNAGQDADTTHFGTKAYAPPEQFGFGQTDVRSDVYSLGMVAYYMLTEETPTPAHMFESKNSEGIDANLQSFIKRATAFDPANRFQSVAEMKAEFEALMHEDETEQMPKTPRSALGKTLKNGKTLSIRNVAITIVLAFFVCLGASLCTDYPEGITGATQPIYSICYFCYVLFFFGGWAYLLAGKKSLSTWVPPLKNLTLRQHILIAAVVIIIGCTFAILTPRV